MTDNTNNEFLVQRMRRAKWGAFALIVLFAVGVWIVGRNSVSTTVAPAPTVSATSPAAEAPAPTSVPAATTPATGAPEVAIPAGGFLTSTAMLTGTGQPGATIRMLVDGNEAATATVDATGAWAVTLAEVTTGDHEIQVEMLDSAGNTIAQSVPSSVTIAGLFLPQVTVAPVLPALPAGTVVTDTTELTGTGTPGTTVRVLVDGSEIATTEVDANGAWSITLGSLAEGDHQVQVEAVDASGNTIAVSEPSTVTATGPSLPLATLPVPSLALPVKGELSAAQPLTGTAQPGNTVRVLIDGQEAAVATVEASGTWTATLATVPPGEHQVQVEETDSAGNLIAASEPVTLPVTLARTPETPPAVEPTRTPAATAPVEPVSTPAATAPAEPVSTPAATATPEPALTLVVTATTGPASVPATTVTTEPVSTLVAIAPSEPTSALAPTSTAEPTSIPTTTVAVEPTTTPVPVFTAEPQITPEVGVTSEPAGTPATTATTEPTSLPTTTVAVEPATTPVPVVTAEPKITPEVGVTSEPAGTPATTATPARTTTPATKPTLAPADSTVVAPIEESATVTSSGAIPSVPQVELAAPILTLTADSIVTSTATFTGTTTPGALVRVLVNDKDVVVTKADASGVWTATLSALPEGENLLQVEVLDTTGKTIASSTPVTLSVTPASALPAVDTVEPAQTPTVLPLSPEATSPATGVPTVPPTSEPIETAAETPAVLPTPEPISTSTAAPAPTSAVAATPGMTPLPGPATRPAATEAATPSAPTTIVPDQIAPARPSVEAVAPVLILPAGAVFTGTTVLGGSGEPGSSVRIVVDGKDTVEAEVDASGVWTATLEQVPEGDHVVQVEAIDATGQVIAESAPVALSVTLAGTPTPVATNIPSATATPRPAVTATSTAAGTAVPSLLLPASGSFTRTAVISGTAAPGALVRILVDGKDMAATKVDDSGLWRLTLTDLPLGEHTVQAEMIDATGKTLAASEPAEILVRPAPAPTPAPTSAPTSPPATMTATATDVPQEEAAAPIVELPPAGIVTGTTALSGQGQPGGTIRVLVDGKEAATAEVGSTGSWTATIPAIRAGDHLVQIQALDAAGNVIAEAAPVVLTAAKTAKTPTDEPPDHLPTTGLNARGDAAVPGTPIVVLALLALVVIVVRRRQ